MCSGQWMGLQKSGVGIYSYPSAASYAGQWINNVKDGYGTYKFPKGGLYKVPRLLTTRMSEHDCGSCHDESPACRGNGLTGLWMVWVYVSLLTEKCRVVYGDAGNWCPSFLCRAVQQQHTLHLMLPRLQLHTWWGPFDTHLHVLKNGVQAWLSINTVRWMQASGDRSAVLSKLVLAQPAIWVTMASLAVSCTQSTIPPSILTAANALSILHAPLAFLAMGICVGAPSLSNVQHSAASSLAVCHLPALLTSAALILAQQPVMAAAALLFSLGEGGLVAALRTLLPA